MKILKKATSDVQKPILRYYCRDSSRDFCGSDAQGNTLFQQHFDPEIIIHALPTDKRY